MMTMIAGSRVEIVIFWGWQMTVSSTFKYKVLSIIQLLTYNAAMHKLHEEDDDR